MSLNPKQQRFVDEYLIDLNATQAYIRAGYSPNGADKLASRLMGKDGVRAAIEAGRARLSEISGVTQEKVLKGLVKEATREGEGASHAARVTAWGLLGKHLGILKDRVEHTGADGGPLAVKASLADEILSYLRDAGAKGK